MDAKLTENVNFKRGRGKDFVLQFIILTFIYIQIILVVLYIYALYLELIEKAKCKDQQRLFCVA